MPTRFVLVLGTFLLSMLLYVDRVAISAAKDEVATAFDFDDKAMGWVLGAFTVGYALCQVPAGMLADRYGPRRILTAAVGFWSLFTILTAHARGFVSMVTVRFLFGAGESGAFPGCARAIFSWIPMAERGLVQGINFSGSRLGAAFTLPVIAGMIEVLGWQRTFELLGIIGFGWAIFWLFWFRDEPEKHAGISAEELAYIQRTRQSSRRQFRPRPERPERRDTGGETSEKGSAPAGSGALIRSPDVWLAMAQYFCSNFTFFFCLSWLFPHLKTTYGLETAETGLYAAAPFLFGALGNWVAGWMVDRIYRSGRWTLSRRLPAIIGFSLAAVGLVGSVYMTNALGAVACLSLAIFGADMTLSPSWAVCTDIGKTRAGAVSGTMNMAGNIGSFATSLAFPYLKAWTRSIFCLPVLEATVTMPFFFVGAALNGVAVVLWLFIRPDRSLEY